MYNEEQWKIDITNISRHSIRYLDNLKLPENPAIVFDIDNTLIDNTGKCIIPIAVLYHYAKMLGISPIIITSRVAIKNIIDYTLYQLKLYGILDYKLLFMRKNEQTDNWIFKQKSRKNAHDRGFNIIMSVGDSEWDITNGYTGYGVKIPLNPLIQNYYN